MWQDDEARDMPQAPPPGKLTECPACAKFHTLEFERTVNGKIISGRQSQVWVRLPEGWKIVAAHVSIIADPEAPKVDSKS